VLRPLRIRERSHHALRTEVLTSELIDSHLDTSKGIAGLACPAPRRLGCGVADRLELSLDMDSTADGSR